MKSFIEIEWTALNDDRHSLWSAQLCLYSYLHPDRDWLLYVGKADFSTVRSRLHGDHKARLFSDIRKQYGIDHVRVMHGDLILPSRSRRSSELLADVESLLIKRLKPFGNIQSIQHRIARLGMRVQCIGDWPLKRSRFHDVD